MAGKPGTLAERFARHYIPEPNSGCWLWTATLGTKGYGDISGHDGRTMGAHVLSYNLHKGPIPKGLIIRHKCDVRSCVNPDHLLVGTPKQNMADCVTRGRAARGFQNANTRLSDDQVKAIVADPRKQAAIAAEYGVCRGHVGNIKAGKRRIKQ